MTRRSHPRAQGTGSPEPLHLQLCNLGGLPANDITITYDSGHLELARALVASFGARFP